MSALSRMLKRWMAPLDAKAGKRLLDPKTFESLWRPEDRPESWRASPKQQQMLLQAYEIAAVVAGHLAQARDRCYARMERLRGPTITEAHEVWRRLMAGLVQLESAFESLMLSPGLGLHAAEGLSMLNSAGRACFPLEDRLARMIIERRYEVFLSALGVCEECLRVNTPYAPEMSEGDRRELMAEWSAIKGHLAAAVDQEVRMRMEAGRYYLLYGGLLSVSATRDSLRDEMHESLAQAKQSQQAESAGLRELRLAAEEVCRSASMSKATSVQPERTLREAALLSHMRRLSQAHKFAEFNEFIRTIPEAFELLNREISRRAKEQKAAPPEYRPPGIMMEPPGDEPLPEDVVARLKGATD